MRDESTDRRALGVFLTRHGCGLMHPREVCDELRGPTYEAVCDALERLAGRRLLERLEVYAGGAPLLTPAYRLNVTRADAVGFITGIPRPVRHDAAGNAVVSSAGCPL
jgi:hypothetical protein